MPFIYPNGLGLTGGGELGTGKPLYTTGVVQFVSSLVGDNTNTGRDRNHPVATIAQAVTNIGATDDGIIVIMANSELEIGTEIGLSQRVNIIGEGLASGRPTVELTLAGGTHDIFSFNSGSGNSRIENIRFRPPGNAASPSGTTGFFITSAQDDIEVSGCEFEVDQHINSGGVNMQATANAWRWENCTFTSTEVDDDPTLKPFPAFVVAGAINRLLLIGCTFDGGTVGFQDGSGNNRAFDASAGVITDLRVRGLSLLRGADFVLASSTFGYITRSTITTGSSQIVWP